MLRLVLCIPFVLACGLCADEKPQRPRESPLRQGTVKVQGDNLVCVVYMRRQVEREVAETVVEKGQAFTVKRKVTVEETVPEERHIPLKAVRGYVVGAGIPDPSKALRPLDPSKVAEVVEKDWRGWFIAAGEKPPIDYIRDFKPGLVIFILPDEKK